MKKIVKNPYANNLAGKIGAIFKQSQPASRTVKAGAKEDLRSGASSKKVGK